MNRHLEKLSLVIILTFLFIIPIVIAAQYSGDGTYTVKLGDTVTVSDDWKIEIKSIVYAPSGETLGFIIYDDSGKDITSTYTESITKLEGPKKFGNSTHLKLKISILGVSGESTPVSAAASRYENAQITIESIDELLPGAIQQQPTEIEEVVKELTYKGGVISTLSIGEQLTLGNGYRLVFDKINDRWGTADFSLYDTNNKLLGDAVNGFYGSYVNVKNVDSTNKKIDVLVEKASKITFSTGWNLFSIPIEDGDGYGTVLESTCNKATIWSWNNNIGDYAKIGKLEEGTKIPTQKGLWVEVQTKNNVRSSNDCDILISGTKSVTLRGLRLKTGWNLINSPITALGYTEKFEGGTTVNLLNFNDIKGTCEIEKGPWQFLSMNPGTGEIVDENKFSKPFNNNLKLFRGYFIKVTNDCELADR